MLDECFFTKYAKAELWFKKINESVDKMKMKAAMIRAYGHEELKIVETEVPKVGAQDVLVKIVAASINPIDLKTKEGKVKMLLDYQLPLILGSDFAGIIQEAGKEVEEFRVGDEVYGRVQKHRIGTFAEYLAVDQKDIARKPKNLTFEEAAGVPLVALTSYQGLHDVMKIQSGDKVLIQAGSGGIGTMAIQLAKLAGAYVATTTSTKNVEFVKSLGADQVIDYRQQDFAEVLTEYDFVFDTLGGENLERAFEIIKPGGKVVTLSGIPNRRFGQEYGSPLWKQVAFGLATRKLTKLEKKSGATYHFLFMKPSGSQLQKITELIEGGKLVPVVDSVWDFAKIQEAFAHSASGRARGKIIIKL